MVTRDLIAIIPARGGSRRLPRKAVIDFAGQPMIAWTIAAAREAGMFDRIVVSTDDAEFAAVGREHGAEAPFLRDRAADDSAPVSEATLATLGQCEQYWNEQYRSVVQLMPNCPLRGAAQITSAVRRFRESGAPFLLSCFRYGWMNPWWAHTIDAKGHPTALFADKTRARSQDLQTLYCPTGAVWIANVKALRDSGTFYGPGHVFFPIDWKAAVDIDDSEDLEMALALCRTTRPCA
jgi:N-acylneuraminate cytidylyltransferase